MAETTPVADDGEELRREMLRDVLTEYKAEHARLVDRWKMLETKAQGAVAIAGIFLGGVFTFIRDLETGAPAAEPWLLIVIALLLTLTVVCSVMALRVSPVTDPAPGKEEERMAKDLAGRETAEIRSFEPAMYFERFEVWRPVTGDLRAMVYRKAGWLAVAQYAILAAVVLMCVVSVVLVVTRES